MNCGICGTPIAEGDFICSDCAKSGGPPPSSASAEEAPEGVGGWLLFFCITLTILSPLRLLGEFNSVRQELSPRVLAQPAFRALIFGCGVLNVSVAVILFVAGFMLWSRMNGAVRAAKIALLYHVCSLGPLVALSYLVGLPPHVAKVWSLTILQRVPLAIIYPLIWFLYLSYSQRVRATYPSEFLRS